MTITISGRSHSVLPVLAALGFVVGSVLFAKGFLLNRIEIQHHQQCRTSDPTPSVIEPNVLLDMVYSGELETSGGKRGSACGHFKRFNKAIFLIIDALRYDFTVYNETKTDDPMPYENKLLVIKQLLHKKPANSALFKFIADPPTTTLQRLKGLTTGSLPTFIDAGNNFASSEVAEDNLILQMRNSGMSIIFMGDDTWESLYKKHFYKSYPFPSFNVKDLHTVDNGCIENLVPEIERRDWDVIISHFLGVDHCGHRFGPDHPAMAEKLKQMNEVIRTVVERLENDTVLFVLGDHGMTKTGDHGGESPEEVAAALFVHSPAPLRGQFGKGLHQDSVAQIDLVPTVALLLGLPIPFSNLGRLIPEFFTIPNGFPSSASLTPDTAAHLHYVTALSANVEQVKAYMRTYHNLTGALPHSFTSESDRLNQETQHLLQRLAVNLRNRDNPPGIQQNLKDVEELLISYLDLVRATCHKIWAQFDDLSITLGVCFVFNMLFTNVMCLFGVRANVMLSLSISSQMIFIISQWSSPLYFLLEVALISITSFLTSKVGSASRKLNATTESLTLPWSSLFTLIVSVAHSLSLTSNSFVMYEAQVTAFLTCSVFAFVCLFEYMRCKSSGHPKRKPTFGNIPKISAFLMLYLAASRLSQLFWSCREEQPWCDVSIFMSPLHSLRSSAPRFASRRYVVSVACVLLPVFALRKWLQKQGNYDGTLLRQYAVNYILPISAVCISMHWAMQALPSDILDGLPSWQQTFLPQIAYAMLLVSIISIFLAPTCVHILPREEARKIKEAVEAERTSERQNHPNFKGRRNAKKRTGEAAQENNMTIMEDIGNVPVVCGLGTAYSANSLQFLVTLYLLLSLLLGDGMAPALVLLALQILIVAEVRSVAARDEETHKVPYVPIWLIGLWSLMSAQYFFATGHQATIPSIRFETAFIGYHGDYPSYLYWIPAVLILLNTFASQVMSAAALPLTLLWPLARGRSSSGPQADGLQGEMELQKDPDLFKRRLAHLVFHYLNFQALQLFGTMLAAALHRRHLMAWGIFAPRFIFQGVAFLVTLPSLAASCGVLLFSHRALEQWIQKHLHT